MSPVFDSTFVAIEEISGPAVDHSGNVVFPCSHNNGVAGNRNGRTKLISLCCIRHFDSFGWLESLCGPFENDGGTGIFRDASLASSTNDQRIAIQCDGVAELTPNRSIDIDQFLCLDERVL